MIESVQYSAARLDGFIELVSIDRITGPIGKTTVHSSIHQPKAMPVNIIGTRQN